MRLLLPAIMVSVSLLSGGCAKEMCPGEVRAPSKYTSPAKFSSARDSRKKAKPSLIHLTKSSNKRKPPEPTYFSQSTASKRKPPK